MHEQESRRDEQDRHGSKRIYRVGLWLFVLWTLAAGGYALLLLNTRGGHPPAFVYAPFMIPVWIVGSVILLLGCVLVAWSAKSNR